MGLLRLLVLCILATCYRAASSPQEVPKPSPLLSRNCSDSNVLVVADLALQEINKEREDGYVLTLNRINSVWEQKQDDIGSLFYLILDVLETDCHVLSRKTWKICRARIFHESIYGQCQAMFYINETRKVFYLPAYNCTLHPVSQRQVQEMCPDCPSPVFNDLSDPGVLEAARQSLAKYNSKSPSKQYSFVKVTRMSSQWVFGPTYFVEFLVKESPCTKSQASNCSLQSSDSAPIGLCTGSVAQRNSEKYVSVTCEFFTSQVQSSGGKSSVDRKRTANVKKTETSSKSPSKTISDTSIKNLPNTDEDNSQGTHPHKALPMQLDPNNNPKGVTIDISFLFQQSNQQKLTIFPFPREKQNSNKCPGPAKNASPLLLIP